MKIEQDTTTLGSDTPAFRLYVGEVTKSAREVHVVVYSGTTLEVLEGPQPEKIEVKGPVYEIRFGRRYRVREKEGTHYVFKGIPVPGTDKFAPFVAGEQYGVKSFYGWPLYRPVLIAKIALGGDLSRQNDGFMYAEEYETGVANLRLYGDRFGDHSIEDGGQPMPWPEPK